MLAAIIEARDLVKRFDGFTAVDRISFAVPEGVIFGFLGPNGRGAAPDSGSHETRRWREMDSNFRFPATASSVVALRRLAVAEPPRRRNADAVQLRCVSH
jgi:hypothetical protein